MSEAERRLDRLVGDDEWARHEILEQLRERGASDEELGELAAVLAGDDASRRSAARMALAALADPASPASPAARAALEDGLRSDDADVRVLAASALGEAGAAAAAPALVESLRDPDPNVAAAAADALGLIRHPPTLSALAEAAGSGSFWVRAAAVVALGRLQDERALPALARAAGSPGLERPLVEALRAIDHPDALDVLEVIRRTAPDDALVAAGAILAAHPDVAPPPWVVEGSRASAEALRVKLIEDDDPAVGRLLGIAATPTAVETLVDLVGPPRRSEAALTGLLAVPDDVRSAALIERMEDADGEELIALLSLLPPQTAADHVRALVPYLSHDDPTVRAAAAEALGRAPVERALPLLTAELNRQTPTPDVVRALGGLGAVVCGALLPLLSDPASAVRAAAAEALGRCRDPSVTDALAEALEEEDDGAARASFLRAIGRLGGDAQVPRLARGLEDPDPEVRLGAIDGLGASGSSAAVEPLRRAADGPPHQKLAVLRALGELGVPEAAPALAPFLAAPDVELRRAAARAAVPLAAALAERDVAALGRDEDEWVRVFAVRMLERRGTDARARLGSVADEDASPLVRAEARRVLTGGA